MMNMKTNKQSEQIATLTTGINEVASLVGGDA